jgi:hypothetical protein
MVSVSIVLHIQPNLQRLNFVFLRGIEKRLQVGAHSPLQFFIKSQIIQAYLLR